MEQIRATESAMPASGLEVNVCYLGPRSHGRKKILILCLFAGSIALASETMHWIVFGQGPEWSVQIRADGSAMMLYGSSDKVEAPPGSFDLKKIDAELGPLVTTNPGLEKGVNLYSSLRTGPVVKNHCCPKQRIEKPALNGWNRSE